MRTVARRAGRWGLGALAVLVVFGGPVVLLWYFGGSRLLSSAPLAGGDFDTHISQVWRVLEGLSGWGRSWVYDVQHLAGYPNGTIFDADNKGWELFTFALTSVGVERGLAFNLFIVSAHLLVAPVVYASARLFGLRSWSALLAAGLGVLYWYFDSWLHWEWYIGMIAHAFASYLFLLPLASFYRWSIDRRSRWIVLSAVTLASCHLVHPYSFFLLVVPMVAIYLRQARSLTRGEHLAVWGMAAFTVAVNAWWIAVALSFWHYILDSSYFGHSTAVTLVWDMFGLVGDPGLQGVIGNRTGFRTLIVAGGVVGLFAWYRRGDDRLLPLGATMVVFAALAYLGGYTFFAHIQPYRHIGPLGFVALVPASAAVELLVRERLIQRMSTAGRAIAIVLLILAGQHLVRDVLYFGARSLPKPARLPHGEQVTFSVLGYGVPADYSYADWHADDVAAWVRAHDDGSGRFLVEGWSLGEQLTWKTDAQILGGFIWRNLEHSWANFFRRRPQGIARSAELNAYFETYGVKWVLVSTPPHLAPWWDENPVLERVAAVGHVRIYRPKLATSLFARGSGRIHADTNRITVTQSDPDQDLVLRYHWLETLQCVPDCEVQRHRSKHDKVGFIRIPAPHPHDLEIRNVYHRAAL